MKAEKFSDGEVLHYEETAPGVFAMTVRAKNHSEAMHTANHYLRDQYTNTPQQLDKEYVANMIGEDSSQDLFFFNVQVYDRFVKGRITRDYPGIQH